MKNFMHLNLSRKFLKGLFFSFLIAVISSVFAFDAQARVGGGRSFGRSAPARSGPQRYSAPNNSGGNPGGFGNNNRVAPPPAQPQSAPMAPPPQQPPRNSFLKGMAGGLAGGFLGSMLFNSLGHASGGMGGGGGFGGGGIGFIEIILLAGAAFFAYKYWMAKKNVKNNSNLAYQNQAADAQTSWNNNDNPSPTWGGNPAAQSGIEIAPQPGYRALEPLAINPELASELFFKVQAAWTRRDLSTVKNIMGPEIFDVIEKDLKELRALRQINKLENISVRKSEIVNSWSEQGFDYSSIRFTANLLDYTVDEQSGKILKGSDTEPVRFEEEWIFRKDSNSTDWYLEGIQQNNS